MAERQDQKVALSPQEEVVDSASGAVGPGQAHVLHGLAATGTGRRAGVGVGHRHAARVDQGARKEVVARQTDGGGSKGALDAVGGAQKAGGAVGDQYVLAGGFMAFFVEAGQ